MFEDIIGEETVKVANTRRFHCHECNCSIQTFDDKPSTDCPVCGRILLETLYLEYPKLNKFTTTYSC